MQGSHRGPRRYFRYLVIVFGAVSVFFSAAVIMTSFELPSRFNRIQGPANLALSDTDTFMIAWLFLLIVFWTYPLVFKEAKSSKLVLATNASIPVFFLMMLVWPVASLLLVSSVLLSFAILLHHSQRFLRVPRVRAIILFSATLLALAIPIELLTLSVWLSDPVGTLGKCLLGNGFCAAVRFDLRLFFAGFSTVVWLAIALMISPIVLELVRLLKPSATVTYLSKIERLRMRSLYLMLGLTGVSVFAALVAYLPYSLSQYPVGLDSHWYYETIESLSGRMPSPELVLYHVYLVFLGAIHSIAGLPIRDTVMAGSVIVSMLFALGSYFAVREITDDDLVALFAAFLSGASAQMLVGTLSSIYGNWLALAEMLFLFGFLQRTVNRSSKYSLAACCLLSLMIMVTHVWTWAILLFILLICVVLSALRKRSWRLLLASPAFRVLLVSVLVGIAVTSLAIYSDLARIAFQAFRDNLPHLQNPMMILHEMRAALFNYNTQGFYGNWIMLILAIVGIWGLGALEDPARNILESSILGPSILAFFTTWEIQWRLLFMIPYHIFAALGAFALLHLLERHALQHTSSRSDLLMVRVLQVGFVVLVVLLFLNNAVRSMAIVAGEVVT